jgi:hypothetical protein
VADDSNGGHVGDLSPGGPEGSIVGRCSAELHPGTVAHGPGTNHDVERTASWTHPEAILESSLGAGLFLGTGLPPQEHKS